MSTICNVDKITYQCSCSSWVPLSGHYVCRHFLALRCSLVREPILRKGCPSKLMPIYQIFTLLPEDRRERIHEYMLMRLVHKKKSGKMKNFLNLNEIHHQLELDSMVLEKSGSSNILLITVSFDCLIGWLSKKNENVLKEKRHYFSFDLKIPGTYGMEEKDGVLTYNKMEAEYGSKSNLYAALKHFYKFGWNKGNRSNNKHGHCPDYIPESSRHDQYIRHTEQLLVTYLALPQAADMLCRYLRTEIRGKYPKSSTAKVYNMGLHMHSTKTCCAPCEYALLGLMNDRNGFQQNFGKGFQQLGFIPNFKQACSIPNEQLKFTLPRKSHFRLLVTVTASGKDADHQKQPTYTVKILNPQQKLPYDKICVKDKIVSKCIFTAMLNRSGYDQRRIPSPSTSNLTDKTVVISGSAASPGSSKTTKKVIAAKDNEMDQITQKLGFLELS